ncbi:MAG: DNA/RNA nuclease SfsA [Anaerolineae bacterium]|nr:DNA/RNA nuclease SfsA [Anaerolineae bacterium]MDW8100748.1 DNA/RNA nuclease SfsA [Anaerolineae bacterium]
MRFSQALTPATFVQRVNRFLAIVKMHARLVEVHVPNSGRLEELFLPGRRVWLEAARQPGRRTLFTLRLVELGPKPPLTHEEGATESGPILVSVDARLPAPLFAEAWTQGRLSPFTGYTALQAEARLGDSRIDFRLQDEARVCWVETKSVTLVDEADQPGTALFPDAPTVRGARHLRELMGAAQQGQRAAVVFVVQRSDARAFAPHPSADPAFVAALREATRAGVEVHAYRCFVDLSAITIWDSLPVRIE